MFLIPVSRFNDFQASWLRWWHYHYYFLIWCCQSIMMPDIYVHILNLIETMLFCKHCKKTLQENTGTLSNPLVWKFSASCQFLQILGQFSWKPVETVLQKKISTTGNQSVIYLSLLFNPGLHFSIKCVSYDSLKIFLCSRIAKKGVILKFPPLHVFIWPLISVYCNSYFQICCL